MFIRTRNFDSKPLTSKEVEFSSSLLIPVENKREIRSGLSYHLSQNDQKHKEVLI